MLTELGADVNVVDPHVEAHPCPPGVKLVELTDARIDVADAVVILTDHDDVDYETVEARARWILDTRHRLAMKHVEFL